MYALLDAHQKGKRKKSVQQILAPFDRVSKDRKMTKLRIQDQDLFDLIEEKAVVQIQLRNVDALTSKQTNNLLDLFHDEVLIPSISFA